MTNVAAIIAPMRMGHSAIGTFDRAKHRYYSASGASLVSVTTAMRAAGIIDQSWYSDEARERGRLVHVAVHYDAENDLDESTVAPHILPYVVAARKFRAETGFSAVSNETQVYCPVFGYAGTFDAQGMVDRRRTIIDYKSGAVQFWAALQLAAYANNLEGGGGFVRWGVELKPDGTYKITTFHSRDFRSDLADFLSCVRVARIQSERGLLEA